MIFTEEQQKVIDTRNCDILVSAAAGSGKTAVLVERILRRILDKNNPVEVDRLLIMTFTRDSAGEMKQRLEKAIYEAIDSAQAEGNMDRCDYLRRQAGLIATAYISTIDSFCIDVLRNNFSTIGLDPSFRVGDEGELKLLRTTVLEQLLEEFYQQGDETFFSFVEFYCTKRDDSELELAVENLYNYAQSAPNPQAWIEGCADIYECENEDELFDTPLMRDYLKHIGFEMGKIREIIRLAAAVSAESDGPWKYLDVLEGELEAFDLIIEKVKAGEPWDELRAAIAGFDFKRFPPLKDPSVNADKQEKVKALREKYKTEIKKLAQGHFRDSVAVILADLSACRQMAKVLIDLTIRFSQQYSEEKRRLGIVDFSDVEHMALQVLYKDEELSEPSAVAEEYRELFEEIYIDEYQDSNAVQESLLQAIRRREDGLHNLFMVGDIKQSIYRFRLACPDIFNGKLLCYDRVQQREDGTLSDELRIDLHRNFRSRKEVVDAVNTVFETVMTAAVGNVDYDEDARLVYAADYNDEASEQEDMWTPELMLIKPDKDVNKIQLEAIAIAERITDLMKTQRVKDKVSGKLRELRYGDIAILLRSVASWDDVLLNVLDDYGIPCLAENKTGYFGGYEIRTILDYLTIIDNPRNDEALCAALKGFFGRISDEELALIRIYRKKVPFYQAAMEYALCWENGRCEETEASPAKEDEKEEKCRGNENVDVILQGKLQKFFGQLAVYREMVTYLPVHNLIARILNDTEFESAVYAMDGGEKRRLNLQLLQRKAEDYERTSYKGLYNFIRYIELLKKYEVDYGQAQSLSADADAVRLLTIHKSKGLEFPVCFLCDMGKQINLRDMNAQLIMDNKGGIGMDVVDTVKRVKSSTIAKRALAYQIESETIGEELRILYVAMTRAKEKLIMTGVIDTKQLEDMLSMYGSAMRDSSKESIPVQNLLLDKKAYIYWVLAAFIRSNQAYELIESIIEAEKEEENRDKLNAELINDINVIISRVGTRELIREEVRQVLKQSDMKQQYYSALNETYDLSEMKRLELSGAREEEKVYIPQKVSVSYLKHNENENTDVFKLYEEKKLSKKASRDKRDEPDFVKIIRGEKKPGAVRTLVGSLRGTAYHRMFELLDYSGSLDEDDIKNQIAAYVADGRLEREMAAALDPKSYAAFAATSIGQRMKKAFLAGTLKREQPFCVAFPANTLGGDYSKDDTVLVQGIIDALFVEDGKYVIVDYKTDNVEQIEHLSDLYKSQLDYYGRAIEQILEGAVVGEKVIYSVKFSQELKV